MVQLRVKFLENAKGENTLFQFQYGSIKSSKKGKNDYYKKRFQFQYGSIKSLYKLL